MTAFLNVHILQPAPLSNLNRDDTGAPKTLVYGGSTRARWSSQSLKRAARLSFEGGSAADRTVRSKKTADTLAEAVIDELTAGGHTVDDNTRRRLVASARRKINTLVTKDPESDNETLIWLAEHEVDHVRQALLDSVYVDTAPEAPFVRSTTQSLSIAGFGRMFAHRPEWQTEAAVQVAHAFTVNTASMDVDYFTAVDDLRTSDPGAGHLDVAPYTSGVFYRYLNIDRRQLARNWERPDSAEETIERLSAFFSALLLSLPAGKQNSTAPHTPPAFIQLCESSMGASLASAFEHPVVAHGGGYLTSAVESLASYEAGMRRCYPSQTRSLATLNIQDPGSHTFDDLVTIATDWLMEA
jgi:CRISPR system Cascade subunit CasC